MNNVQEQSLNLVMTKMEHLRIHLHSKEDTEGLDKLNKLSKGFSQVFTQVAQELTAKDNRITGLLRHTVVKIPE